MKKPEIAKKIARRSGVSRAEAADRLDTLVSGIIANLRQGKDTDLPGLGRFVHAADGSVSFERAWSPERG
jgi:nucleoid DNA-binding protein